MQFEWDFPPEIGMEHKKNRSGSEHEEAYVYGYFSICIGLD